MDVPPEEAGLWARCSKISRSRARAPNCKTETANFDRGANQSLRLEPNLVAGWMRKDDGMGSKELTFK
ncbi:MAG: hypothetical protein Tsb0019_03760 [Roseibium sp.]